MKLGILSKKLCQGLSNVNFDTETTIILYVCFIKYSKF